MAASERVTAAVLIIGDEILSGRTQDTNLNFIAKYLATYGVDLAEALIQSRGYSAFSYQDISDRLGIRKASIHYHFPSKTDLGVAALQVTPVHYLFRPDDDSMVRHFETIAAEGGVPVIIYNVVPWAYLMPPLLMRMLRDVPGVIGVHIEGPFINELRKGGTPPASIKEVTVSPEEYPHYLELAYRASPFPKPRNAIGMVRDLPVPDMEKLILASTDITDADLRELAEQRAQTAQQYLVSTGGVDASRIYLVAPKSVHSESKGAESKSTESTGTESTGAESKGAESTGTESTGTESKGAESAGIESKNAESKSTESKGTESKGAETKGAETKDSKSQASNKLTRADFTLK